MTDLISIITPLYNSELFVEQTIRSIISQTYSNWEMLIIDDCSTDRSLEIARYYVNVDKRIKLIKHSNNKGAAEARNTGIKNAIGRYIAFVDSDDIWLPHKLELQINQMVKYNYAITYTSYRRINENGIMLNETVSAKPILELQQYLMNTVVGFSTVVIDTHLVAKICFMNVVLHEDMIFIISLFKQGFNLIGISETLVQYRVRKSSLSSNKFIAAKQVWNIYYNLEKFGLLHSVYYFSGYLYNAIKRRL